MTNVLSTFMSFAKCETCLMTLTRTTLIGSYKTSHPFVMFCNGRATQTEITLIRAGTVPNIAAPGRMADEPNILSLHSGFVIGHARCVSSLASDFVFPLSHVVTRRVFNSIMFDRDRTDPC